MFNIRIDVFVQGACADRDFIVKLCFDEVGFVFGGLQCGKAVFFECRIFEWFPVGCEDIDVFDFWDSGEGREGYIAFDNECFLFVCEIFPAQCF